MILISRQALAPVFDIDPLAPTGNAVKHLVAKLVKSFGRLGHAAESLDDFRYIKAWDRGWA